MKLADADTTEFVGGCKQAERSLVALCPYPALTFQPRTVRRLLATPDEWGGALCQKPDEPLI